MRLVGYLRFPKMIYKASTKRRIVGTVHCGNWEVQNYTPWGWCVRKYLGCLMLAVVNLNQIKRISSLWLPTAAIRERILETQRTHCPDQRKVFALARLPIKGNLTQ